MARFNGISEVWRQAWSNQHAAAVSGNEQPLSNPAGSMV
jgi:hypothetical protein